MQQRAPSIFRRSARVKLAILAVLVVAAVVGDAIGDRRARDLVRQERALAAARDEVADLRAALAGSDEAERAALTEELRAAKRALAAAEAAVALRRGAE